MLHAKQLPTPLEFFNYLNTGVLLFAIPRLPNAESRISQDLHK
jgi:hypothetical protein